MASLSELLKPFNGERLIEWFVDLTELWHDTAPIKPNDISSPRGLTQWIHYKNFVVWHLKERVRQENIPESDIVEAEKTIDVHNMKRLAAIEQIDIWIDNVLQSADVKAAADACINSETPGSIVDRLSVLVLKIYHMEAYLRNNNLDEKQRKKLRLQMQILQEQRDDLANALDTLMLEMRQGKKRHKVYRQFKIYNDPSFHPEHFGHNI
ncbi:DUF4254 domain-containing protein [candidate division KSB1 bacterium]|nr:DUF4254 domain-containing protein [candidate division KSB1 bacterium]RQW05611.1 MAG: DUF4254 domain-containing protein [candidate division KSB1 bacterium]